jgi:arylsulfatase A-like enzyme
VSALAALAFVSCASPRGSEVDLLALFPFTEHGQEVQQIDLGTPAAEPHLVVGWSEADRLPSGDSVAWAIARRATLRFTIREPTEGRMVIRCGIPGAEQRRVVPIIVSLNNRRVGAMRLRSEMAEQTLRVPLIAQRAGNNELTLASPFFSFAAVRAKRPAPAMACDAIRFEGINADAAPRPTVTRGDDGGALVLPPAARVNFHLRVPAAAALAFDLPEAGNLRVALEPETGGEVVLHDGPAPAGEMRNELSRQAGQLVRLSFEATGDAPVRVRDPMVVGGQPSRPSALAGTGRASRPNILLYVVDTLRADHLGCYGYSRPTSPHLDALAAEGILFSDTIAQASWTTPATASIMTGRYPIGHGALTLGEGMRLEVPTLAELLRAAGYRTAGFVTNGNVTGTLGFRRGFDEYVYIPEDRTRPTVHAPADELNARVLEWLRREKGRPFFLYVHATDPHAPYAPPDRLRDRFSRDGTAALAREAEPVKAILDNPALRTPENIAYLADLYDAEIAFTDENIGQLLGAFREFGLYEDSLVVVTADHGEEFNDHGRIGHGHNLYDETTKVPLIVRLPGERRGGRRIESMARQIDIMPTMLDYLGVAPPRGVSGRSLLALTEQPDAYDGEAAFSDTRLGMPRRSAVVTAAWKVIESATPETQFEVYDLHADPTEHRDLAATAPVVLGYGRQLLAQWAATTERVRYDPERPTASPTMDEQTKRRLEALGYVDGRREGR